MSRIFYNIKIYILLCVMLFAETSCSVQAKAGPLSDSRFLLDTFVSIKLYDSGNQTLKKEELKEIIKDGLDLVKYYEDLLSKTIETSDIYRINHAGNQYVEVNPDTLEVLEKAAYYGKLSQGIFDVTIGGVVDLWNFTPENTVLPQAEQIKKRLLSVDYTQVEIREGKVRLVTPGASLDLGGIAKGFIADKVASFLRSKNVSGAIISLGGNILTVGQKSNNELWAIGIQKPFEGSGDIIAALRVGEKSVVTSGIYERYFYSGGQIYHHLLDTKTGYPIKTDIVSVTIISDKSVDGDALSTIAFGLGLEKGLALIESLSGVEAIFVTGKNEFYCTSSVGNTIPIEILDTDYKMKEKKDSVLKK